MAEQTAPKIVLELMEKADEAAKRRNFNYAIELLSQAVEIKPDFADSRKRLREVEIIECDNRTTPALLHKIISAATNAVPMLVAVMQASSKKFKECMDTCEKILRRNPLSTFALVTLSKAAEQEKYIDVAIQSMEFARKLKSHHMGILKRLGHLYKANDQVDEAKMCFQSIIARKPGDKESEKALNDLAALSTIIKGGWEDTTTYRDKLKDVDFSQKVEKELRAVKSKEDQLTLEETYSQQLESAPENIDNYRKLGELYFDKRNFDKAIEVYERAIEKFPQNADLRQMRLRVVSGKYDDQIKNVKEKLALNPADKTLADKLEKLEQEKTEFARENLHQHVEKYPNDLALRMEYGGILLETGNIDEAIKQFQLSVKSPKFKALSLGALGKCFFKKGMLDLAISQYKKALEEAKFMDSFKKEVIYHLGRIYEQQEQNELALTQYEIIYEEDIGYEDVAARVEKLYASRKKTD